MLALRASALGIWHRFFFISSLESDARPGTAGASDPSPSEHVGEEVVELGALVEAEDEEDELDERFDEPFSPAMAPSAATALAGNGSPHQLVPFALHSAAHSRVASIFALRGYSGEFQISGHMCGGLEVPL